MLHQHKDTLYRLILMLVDDDVDLAEQFIRDSRIKFISFAGSTAVRLKRSNVDLISEPFALHSLSYDNLRNSDSKITICIF